MRGKRRKSCQKQQQERVERRWLSRDPTQLGPPYWDTKQEQWRAEGAPLCVICREFGHDQGDCPYEDPCFWEAYTMGRVSCASGWFWLLEQQTPSPPQARGEKLVLCEGVGLRPQTFWGRAHCGGFLLHWGPTSGTPPSLRVDPAVSCRGSLNAMPQIATWGSGDRDRPSHRVCHGGCQCLILSRTSAREGSIEATCQDVGAL
ncbi:UNVERIFIED_CONTAM: hypothetical protein FKN15_043930 [Acipenser sinensis]